MAMPKAPQVLVLNNTEWNRLKKAAEPAQPQSVGKSDYLQKLNERSREWMKKWPDSIEGVVTKVTKLKEIKRQREREMVIKYKEIERLKTLIDYEAVEKAKQEIFNNSCYGKQLISALVESKVIEEREAQINFNKKRKDEALQLAKEEELMNTLPVGMEDEQKILKRKEIDKKLAEEYKAIVEENKKKQADEREKEILGELEDARLMKQLLDTEPHDIDDCKRQVIEAAKEHVVDQQYYRKLKETREKEDDAIVHVWKKYHERVRCREQKVLDKIHKARNDMPNLKLTYEMVEKLNDEEQKRYDEFVQKGVDKFDKRTNEEDQKEAIKQNKIKEQFTQYAKDNKFQAELLKNYCHANKCICERQTLAIKKTKSKHGKKNVEINNGANLNNYKSCLSFMKPKNEVIEDLKESKKEFKPRKRNCHRKSSVLTDDGVPSFLKPKNKLIEALKEREKEPTPWTGLKGTHEYFAKQASGILKECRYKKMAQKVVNEYKKVNRLDTLPISNWN